MTENKAKEIIKRLIGISPSERIVIAVNMATKALEEIQQYRAIGTVEEIKKVVRFLSMDNDNGIIEDLQLLNQYQIIGTVEECREARERQRGRKVKNRILLRDFNNRFYSVCGDCPNCRNAGLLSTNTDYCDTCGQKLDWSDTD